MDVRFVFERLVESAHNVPAKPDEGMRDDRSESGKGKAVGDALCWIEKYGRVCLVFGQVKYAVTEYALGIKRRARVVKCCVCGDG